MKTRSNTELPEYFHLSYELLNAERVSDKRICLGMEFHMSGPEKFDPFLKNFILRFGIINSAFSLDLRFKSEVFIL